MDGQTESNIHRAAWSQLKMTIHGNVPASCPSNPRLDAFLLISSIIRPDSVPGNSKWKEYATRGKDVACMAKSKFSCFFIVCSCFV